MAENPGLELGDDFHAQLGKQHDLQIGKHAGHDHRRHEERAEAVHRRHVTLGDAFVDYFSQDEGIGQLQRGGAKHREQPKEQKPQILPHERIEELEIILQVNFLFGHLFLRGGHKKQWSG